MSRKLYVGNLPYETGEAELQELFGRAGAVDSVTVMRDMATGRARGLLSSSRRRRRNGVQRARDRQRGDLRAARGFDQRSACAARDAATRTIALRERGC